MPASDHEAGRQRLDMWLWFARVVKTREAAAGLVESAFTAATHARAMKIRARHFARVVERGLRQIIETEHLRALGDRNVVAHRRRRRANLLLSPLLIRGSRLHVGRLCRDNIAEQLRLATHRDRVDRALRRTRFDVDGVVHWTRRRRRRLWCSWRCGLIAGIDRSRLLQRGLGFLARLCRATRDAIGLRLRQECLHRS